MNGQRDIAALLSIMARLRDPQGGCPWDLQQDFSTIAPYTVEEAYEVADAIDRHDLADLRDELGDLLLQVVFHARMAEEQGLRFRRRGGIDLRQDGPPPPARVRRCRRGRRRRGQRQLGCHKARRARSQGEADASALAGIARGLPEWQRAQKLQSRAARSGFDWPDAAGVLAKLREETAEVEAEFARGDVADNHARLEDEIGDVLFVCTSLARHAKVDVGAALRRANHKFERRFRAMEALAERAGAPLSTLPLDAQDALWNRAKRDEPAVGE
jgi:ATP diphosphatase